MKGRFVCVKCGETMGNKFSTGNKVCRKCNPFPTVKKAEIEQKMEVTQNATTPL